MAVDALEDPLAALADPLAPAELLVDFDEDPPLQAVNDAPTTSPVTTVANILVLVGAPTGGTLSADPTNLLDTCSPPIEHSLVTNDVVTETHLRWSGL